MSSAPRLQVVYRDPFLLVVNKPSALLVHNGWGREPRTALSLARSLAGRRVHPVHRLDRATSGILVFALDAPTAQLSQQSFLAPTTRKTYCALVRGIPPELLR